LEGAEYVQNTRFIELAGEINSAMPEYVVQQVVAALNDRRKALNGSKVLVSAWPTRRTWMTTANRPAMF
jgi:UDP-N-acetyl-D-glucosamine dehydrogenase